VGRRVNGLLERWQSNTVLFHDMLINSCGPWVSATDRRHAPSQGPVWRRRVSKQQPCMADKMRVFGLKWWQAQQNYTHNPTHSAGFRNPEDTECTTRLER